MALTGERHGPALVAPATLATSAAAVVGELALRAGARWRLGALDGAALLGERAAIFGYRRNGRISPGATCRLTRARDGWIAINLPRADDWAALAAWLESEGWAGVGGTVLADEGAWARLAADVSVREKATLLERARWLGLAVADAEPAARSTPAPWSIFATGERAGERNHREPLVLDLASLWAGPLAGHLLLGAGARVVKLESARRPDGARLGPRGFFDLLNGGKECVALDLREHEDRTLLARLIARADVILESTRPRALEQLGIDAVAWVRGRPGRVWVSITGYGREAPGRDWVAFGDDAAAAAGLALATGVRAGLDGPIGCGDAIADPLAGTHAALAAFAAWQEGGGVGIDVSLAGVTRHLLERAPMPPWTGGALEVAEPRARVASVAARALGEDTSRVLAELEIRAC
ncbi:MAG: CoA transferase [bacterium]